MSWIREANAEPIPGYRLIEPIGSGGFGEVWKCEAPGGLCKAIKFVYGHLGADDLEGIRADQEWKALQRIKDVRHPFVCSVERIDAVEGELVIVMELAEQTLHDSFEECQSAGQLGIPGDDLFRYIRDAAEALDFINEKHNLQHLDVKPRNLFLIGDRVKVADFGLVKHLDRQNTGVMGSVTPLYASPETFQGKLSPQCDQYSLAVVYQEMLTGHLPFQGKNVSELAQKHIHAEPDLRSLPESERAVIGRALAKDPNKRFANCMAFVSALYKARSSARVLVPSKPDPKLRASKPMSATMEDVFLDDENDRTDTPSTLIDMTSTPTPPQLSVSQEIDAGDLGVTIIQPDHGALRPTLLIGLGSVGRKALIELRCRFLDRFGDLSKIPILRFLYLDVDAEAGKSALQGTPEVALSRHEVQLLGLQPVSNYRRRSLEHLAEWLPREKLYSMPRSLQTQGSRALGRLAFSDHQQRLMGRLRRDLQEITNPDHIFQSTSETGLALSSNTPRVCILAAAGGGCSGMLPDLAYALRRLLGSLRHPEAAINAFLMCGAPNDPATPKVELANVYATLTELNHFSDAAIQFSAQYGADAQRTVAQGPPCQAVYLLPIANRDPNSLRETIVHLGSYLFHELTTPLGLRLDDLRTNGSYDPEAGSMTSLAAPFRSFGTYTIWFPRGLLLHLAAQQACSRLLDHWTHTDSDQVPQEIQKSGQLLVERYGKHDDLAVEVLATRVDELARSDDGQSPSSGLTALLSALEQQNDLSNARDNPSHWTEQALLRIGDWIGGGDEEEVKDWRKTRVARMLRSAAENIALEWEKKLIEDTFALMHFPGARVAAAEMTMKLLQDRLNCEASLRYQAVQQKRSLSTKAWEEVCQAQRECVRESGFRLFGSRNRAKLLRNFMDRLTLFTRLRFDEERYDAARHCLVHLANRLDERVQDLRFGRQRLIHFKTLIHQKAIENSDAKVNSALEASLAQAPLPPSSFWESIRNSDTARVVLPDGLVDLEEAADRFIKSLHADHWLQLDREIYEQVFMPQGGLTGVCITSDLTKMLCKPILEIAAKILGQHLPPLDVAQIMRSDAESKAPSAEELNQAIETQVRSFLEKAKPLQSSKQNKNEIEFLLVPASNSGRALSENLELSLPELRQVRVPGQSDLMFLREQGGLDIDDLKPLLGQCQAAYESLAYTPLSSPHARFDVCDWLPLDP